jgi:hypothetical protein
MADVEQVYLRDDSSGRFHVAQRVDGSEPLVPDACNITGERTYLTELPQDLHDADLCDRCFGAGDPPTLNTRGSGE